MGQRKNSQWAWLEVVLCSSRAFEHFEHKTCKRYSDIFLFRFMNSSNPEIILIKRTSDCCYRMMHYLNREMFYKTFNNAEGTAYYISLLSGVDETVRSDTIKLEERFARNLQNTKDIIERSCQYRIYEHFERQKQRKEKKYNLDNNIDFKYKK